MTQNPPKDFKEFIEAPPFRGLGEKVEDIEKLISDDPDAVTLLDGLLKGKEGAKEGNSNASKNKETTDNNVISCSNHFTPPAKPKRNTRQGNSRAYTLVRLKNERPDLFAQVCAKELTANAAAKLAGWRKQPSPLDALQKAWAKLNDDETAQLLNDLAEIDENLKRNDLTELQQGIHHARRKGIYERLHPETAIPGRGKNQYVPTENISVSTYATDAANAIGATFTRIKPAL